ncbi:heavy-metal-associated domain-containing protein [Flavobacterium sediminilitoris]|uniref:Heavy-metal-associated domain-containing protein n=1 Tax=Flavobacterium sediminilitoris TaxID=2024526 RepID=A0ABY4HQK3_9FLAO|nr:MULTISPECIES: heavy-metal-associated domain-containing protein [Flavobacterium]UOX33789.1 heavy-metal-associated domain-containing protein [Flavobacterium sediminilitoris]
MKNIILKTAMIITIIMMSNNLNAQIAKAEIRATGLTCSMCSNAINKQLKNLPEVQEVDTDLNTNTFIVTLKEGNTINPNVFKESVEKAGFFIGSLILTTNSENVLNDKSFVLIEDKKISTNEEVQIQILDKGYVTDKEFKKLAKKYKNIETYLSNTKDVFHIKVVN